MNTDDLLRRVRSKREFKLEHDGVTLMVRVPTQFEMLKLHGGSENLALGDVALRFTYASSGVRVRDVIGGDDDTAVPCDTALFAEFARNRPELLGKVADEIMRRYAERNKAAETEAGN